MSSFVHPQLPLGFEPGELYTFDSFIAGKNAVAVDLARRTAVADADERQLYFWGGSGRGKSHLLQACCNLAAKQQRTVCYLTAHEFGGQSPDILEGLEAVDLLCLDDVASWLQGDDWEKALFSLINRVREQGHCLMMASLLIPDEGSIKLPDLRSRMSWGPVFHLHELDDGEKYQALSYRARQNGLELPENVAAYLLQRYPRDIFGLFEKLQLLDKASMVMQRRLTIPLVKSVFGD